MQKSKNYRMKKIRKEGGETINSVREQIVKARRC
jgi:hypothetical protein